MAVAASEGWTLKNVPSRSADPEGATSCPAGREARKAVLKTLSLSRLTVTELTGFGSGRDGHHTLDQDK